MLAASPLSLIQLDYVETPSPRRDSAARNICLTAAIAFVAAASFGLAWYRAQSPDLQGSSGFDLAADRSGSMWTFRWNPRAPGLAGARSIHIEIADGLKKSTYPLTPEQVTAGSVLYVPVTTDVRFALRATDGWGRVSRELLFLTGAPPKGRPSRRSRPPV